jgi:hypothetical protein
MKRCPQCNFVYSGADQFCDLDGTKLVEADLPLADREPLDHDGEPLDHKVHANKETTPIQPGQIWKIAVIGLVAGVAIGSLLFLVYYEMTRQPRGQSANASSANPGVAKQQMPVSTSRPSLTVTASPDASPSPSPRPSPAPRQDSAKVELSSSPISTSSTDKTRRVPITIRLVDGRSIEADKVWEGREGIWYRRGGIVTLLDRKQVKTIERAGQSATPSPSTQPSPETVSSPRH